MVGCIVPCIVSVAPCTMGIGTSLKTVFNVLLLQVAKVLTLSLILVTLWAVCYCVLGEVAMPGDIEARKYNLDMLKLFYVRSSSHLCHYWGRNPVLSPCHVHCLFSGWLAGAVDTSPTPFRNAANWHFAQKCSLHWCCQGGGSQLVCCNQNNSPCRHFTKVIWIRVIFMEDHIP